MSTAVVDTNLDVELDAIARSTDLHALTDIVRRGRRTAWEVAAALWRIREARLYKLTHSSWESWLQDNWWGTKRHADRQIAALKVFKEMGHLVPELDASEAHARELARVPPTERAAVLKEAGPNATAGKLREVVERRVAEVEPQPTGQLGFGLPGGPRRDLSQWDTRPETAQRLVEWAGVKPGMKVLEPSAGKGNLLRALEAAGAAVTAVEIDPDRATPLEAVCDDFQSFAAKLGPGDHFDMAVMNPPYENGQDLAHVVDALSLAPVVVVLARLVLLEGKERRTKLWDLHTLRRVRVFSERESFEGDVDGSPKSAFAAFEIRRGPGRSVVEWW